MPIVDRAPDLPLAVPEVDAGIASGGPPGMLLQPGGPRSLLDAVPAAPGPDSAAAASPDVVLALDADRLLRLLALEKSRPPRWTAPAFGREVDLVRGHLRPIRSRDMLAASFGREAFHGRAAPGSDRALGQSAVRVAYALRWLELDGVAVAPTWRSVLENQPTLQAF